MKRLSLNLRLLLAFGCFLGSSAFAQPVSLVSGNDYAPYAGSKLVDGGLTTALVKKAFAQMGDEVTVAWMPWSKGYAETQSGKFSGTFPYNKTDARAVDMLFSETIVSVQERVYVKAGLSKFDFNTIAGFTGSTMCLTAGVAPHPKLAGLLESGKLKRAAPMNVSTCIELVNAGAADFFVLEERWGKAALKVSGLPENAVVMADVAPLSEAGLYLVAPKNKETSKDLIDKFNKGLEQMRKNGTYDQIVKAHSL